MSALWLEFAEVIVLGLGGLLAALVAALGLSGARHARAHAVVYASALLFFALYALRTLAFGTERYAGPWRAPYLGLLATHVLATLAGFGLGSAAGGKLFTAARRGSSAGTASGAPTDAFAAAAFASHDRLARVFHPVWALAALSGVAAYALRVWSPPA